MENQIRRNIKEGRLSRIMSAAQNNEDRREDDIHVKPVDMGLSVIWSSEYYNCDGQKYFDIENPPEISSSVWRIPTKDEIFELYSNCDIVLDGKEGCCVSKKNGNKITLNAHGYRFGGNLRYLDTSYIISNTKGVDKKYDLEGYYGLMINPFNKRKKQRTILCPGVFNAPNCFPLLLVKNKYVKTKQVTEGRLHRIMNAAKNDEIRKEDHIVKEYIDFGDDIPVYWSKEPYTDEAGNDMFSYNEMCDFEVDGWRLPTYDEYMQLDFEKNAKDIRTLYYNQNRYITFKVNGKEFQFRDVPNAIYVRFLLKDKSDSDMLNDMDMSKAFKFNREIDKFGNDYYISVRTKFCQAFLVKDKNKKQ